MFLGFFLGLLGAITLVFIIIFVVLWVKNGKVPIEVSSNDPNIPFQIGEDGIGMSGEGKDDEKKESGGGGDEEKQELKMKKNAELMNSTKNFKNLEEESKLLQNAKEQLNTIGNEKYNKSPLIVDIFQRNQALGEKSKDSSNLENYLYNPSNVYANLNKSGYLSAKEDDSMNAAWPEKEKKKSEKKKKQKMDKQSEDESKLKSQSKNDRIDSSPYTSDLYQNTISNANLPGESFNFKNSSDFKSSLEDKATNVNNFYGYKNRAGNPRVQFTDPLYLKDTDKENDFDSQLINENELIEANNELNQEYENLNDSSLITSDKKFKKDKKDNSDKKTELIEGSLLTADKKSEKEKESKKKEDKDDTKKKTELIDSSSLTSSKKSEKSESVKKGDSEKKSKLVNGSTLTDDKKSKNKKESEEKDKSDKKEQKSKSDLKAKSNLAAKENEDSKDKEKSKDKDDEKDKKSDVKYPVDAKEESLLYHKSHKSTAKQNLFDSISIDKNTFKTPAVDDTTTKKKKKKNQNDKKNESKSSKLIVSRDEKLQV